MINPVFKTGLNVLFGGSFFRFGPQGVILKFIVETSQGAG